MDPWTVCKQCPLSLVQYSNVMLLFTNSAFVHDIILTCDITAHVLKKKKANVGLETRIQTHPNCYWLIGQAQLHICLDYGGYI